MSIEWSSWMWEDRIRIALGYPRDGWVLLVFLTAAFNQHLIIHCSDVFCPFQKLSDWLRKIQSNELPAKISIDEEGQFKTLLALPSNTNPNIIEFYISTNPSWDESKDEDTDVVFKCRTDRKQFVVDFATEVSRWIQEDWQPNLYGGRGYEEDEEEFAEAIGYLKALNFDSLK